MALEAQKHPNQYSFVGNSIVFELLVSLPNPVSIEITIGGNTYTATSYPFKIAENRFRIRAELSDYLRFEIPFEIPEGDIIVPVPEFALPYQVRIEHFYRFDGIAFRGGISNHAFRKLQENGYDIFTYRLLSHSDQFLFTTRTHGKEIKLKETELFPFVFIHPGLPIVFKSESGNEITTPTKSAGVYAMNIRKVLEQFPAGTQRIEVCPNGQYAFHFTILPGKLSEEKYLLRFRNSLGAFEMLEVTGRAMHTPEFSEESLYETLTEFDFYEERRSRVNSKGVIEVETGYKERREFPFILDMIQSDEIYFIYPDGESFRCHVKADSARYHHRITEPTSIKLKVRPVLEEEFATPKIEIPDIQEAEFNTDIVFKVKIDSGNVGQPVTLIALSSADTTKQYRIEFGDGTAANNNFKPGVLHAPSDPSILPGNPKYYSYWYAPPITHVYNQTGIYEVHITSAYHIQSAMFSELQIDPSDPGEWLLWPQDRPHIVEIIRFRSTSISNLNWTFGGLTMCRPHVKDSEYPSFILETPLVTDAVATFHRFGLNVDTIHPNYWTFIDNLLYMLPNLTNMNNTFRECRMREIPIGFLDAQVNVVELFETWKKSWLGYHYFQDWRLAEFIQRSLEGSSYIPMTLLHKMRNLRRLTATFNATMFDQNGGNFMYEEWTSENWNAGNWDGGWNNPCLLLKAEFFQNRMSSGESLGTIESVYLCFGKLNRMAFGKDVFRYIKHCLTNIAGAFTQVHHPQSDDFGQFMRGYMEYLANPTDPNKQDHLNWWNRCVLPGGVQNAIDWLAATTTDIQEILGSPINNFPRVELAMNAFSSILENGNHYGVKNSDNTIIPRFPVIVRYPSPQVGFDGLTYQYGFDGMLFELAFNGSPDGDHNRALTVNVINY